MRPNRWQPNRLPHPWDSPGENTGVGCHFLLQCMKVKTGSEVTQSCPTLRDPMDCSPPGSSAHGISQARVLEWGAVAFSCCDLRRCKCSQCPSLRELHGKPSLTKRANVNLLPLELPHNHAGDAQMCNLAFFLPPSLFFAYQQLYLGSQEQVLGPEAYPGEENL